MHAVGREGRLDPVRAADGAGQLHRGGRREAAVVARVVDDVPTAAFTAYMHNGHAVRVDFLAHFFRGALAGHRRGAGEMQGTLVDVLVVDREQAFGGAAFDGEEVHAVVVHAHGIEQVVGRVVAVLVPGLRVVVQRRAPRREHVGHIALRHDASVRHRRGQRVEAKLQRRGGGDFGRGVRFADVIVIVVIAAITAGQAKAGHRGEGGGKTAAHHHAARQILFQNFAERAALAGVADDLVGDGFAHVASWRWGLCLNGRAILEAANERLMTPR
ncbi:hypothetical protein D3C73_1039010 [compost metagenome]